MGREQSMWKMPTQPVRIMDNVKGMDGDDLLLCIERQEVVSLRLVDVELLHCRAEFGN